MTFQTTGGLPGTLKINTVTHLASGQIIVGRFSVLLNILGRMWRTGSRRFRVACGTGQQAAEDQRQYDQKGFLSDGHFFWNSL